MASASMLLEPVKTVATVLAIAMPRFALNAYTIALIGELPPAIVNSPLDG